MSTNNERRMWIMSGSGEPKYVAVSKDLYHECKCLQDGSMHYRVPTEVYESKNMARRGLIYATMNILYKKIDDLRKDLAGIPIYDASDE